MLIKKRLTALALTAVLSLGMIPLNVSAADKKAGDYTYSTLQDGTVQIKSYKGKADTLTLPTKIDGKTVSTIGEMAFYKNETLTAVSIPKNITAISDHAFTLCTKLKAVDIPNTVKTVGKYAFSGCSSVSKLTIGTGVQSISESAFSNLDSLKKLTVPSNLKTLPKGIFSGCDLLESVKIDKGVKTIGESAFGWCGKLTKINIPNSVTEISDQAFYDCRSLEEIHFPYTVKKMNQQVFGFCKKLKSFDIPTGTKKIDFQAFIGCEKLKTVSIPKSITEISENAFYYCNGLKEVRYEGTKADWKKIKIEKNNDSLSSKIISWECKIPVYTSAKLSDTKLSLKSGQTAKLSVTDEKVKKWSSSDKKTAYYDTKLKKVVALKKGSAKIYATLGSGAVLACKVSVTTSPTLSSYAVSIKKGKTATVKISGKYPKSDNSFKISSTEIVSVISKPTSAKITLKALKKGTATVTATINGTKMKAIKVTVK